MNFPAVVNGDLFSPGDHRRRRLAPCRRLRPWIGPRPDAYLAGGVESDHECGTLRKRQPSGARECGSSSPRPASRTPHLLPSCASSHGTAGTTFCTDDCEPDAIRRDGHINQCVRLAVKAGLGRARCTRDGDSAAGPVPPLSHLGQLAPASRPTCIFATLGAVPPDRGLPRRVVARWSSDRGVAVPERARPVSFYDTVRLGAVAGALGPGSVVEPETTGYSAIGSGATGSVPRPDGVIGRSDRSSCAPPSSNGINGDGTDRAFGIARLRRTERRDRADRRPRRRPVVVGGRPPGVREDMPSLRPESLTSAGMVVQDGRGRLTGAAARRPDERSTRGRRHRPPRLDPALPRRRSVSNLENPFAALSFLGSTVVPELRLTDRGLSTVDGRYHRSR
ncbi:MAG: hypothetical protein R2705_22610 [Ilumatobacteraceae bacterium]